MYKFLLPTITIFIISNLGIVTVSAQQNPILDSRIDSIAPSQRGGTVVGKPTNLPRSSSEDDTLRVTYSFAHDRTARPNDTLFADMYRFNPCERQAVPYTFLGNIGQAHYPLVYQSEARAGLDAGWHQYDLYMPEYAALRFYDTQKPFSEVFYTQAGNQFQGTVSARLAKSFGSNWAASFDYHLFSQKGRYAGQAVRTSHVSLGLRYRSTNNKYELRIAGISNVASTKQNGGVNISRNAIISDSLLSRSRDYAQRETVPVLLTNANDRQERQSVTATQYLRLGGALQLMHEAAYKYEKYFFYDDAPKTIDKIAPSDTSAYTLFFNARGIRQYTNIKSLTNTIALQSSDSARLRFSAGVRHANFAVHQEPFDTVYQNLFAVASVKTQSDARLQLGVDAQYGLAFRNSGDYSLAARAAYRFSDYLVPEVHGLFQRSSPTLQQERFVVTQDVVWRNQFLATTEQALGAAIAIPKFRLRVGADQSLLQNYIYFDSTATARQADKLLSVTRLSIQKDFKFGNFHIDNQLFYQIISQKAYLNLPNYHTLSSLYWEGKLFKNKLFMRGGADVRLIDTYYAPEYNPLVGQFYQQNKQKLSFYPLIDLFLGFRIDSFNGFVRFENMYNAVTQKVYYVTPTQPMRDFNFRFGIQWRFTD